MKKKILFIVLAAIILIAAVGLVIFNYCGSNADGVYASLGSYSVTKEQYTYFCTKGYDAAVSLTGASGSAVWDAKPEGVKTTTWIKDYASKQAQRYLAANQLFDDLGLELTEDELLAARTEAAEKWAYGGLGTAYAKYNISGELYADTIVTEYKIKKLAAHYEDELSTSVSEDDITSYLTDNYASITYFAMSYVDSENDSTKDKFDNYCKQVEDGKDFDALVKELSESGNKFIVTSIDDAKNTNDVIVTKTGSDFPLSFVDELFAAQDGDMITFDDTAGHIYVLSRRNDVTPHLESYREEITEQLIENAFEGKLSTTAESVKLGKGVIRSFDVEALYR